MHEHLSKQSKFLIRFFCAWSLQINNFVYCIVSYGMLSENILT